MSDHDESLLRGPNDDGNGRGPRGGWHYALAVGLFDAGYLLPVGVIDRVIEATLAEAKAVGLIEGDGDR